MSIEWNNTKDISSRNFKCGYCGKEVASNKGYNSKFPSYHPGRRTVETEDFGYIYICHFCNKPTFFNKRSGEQTPGAIFGNDIENINDEFVNDLYNEARRCISSNSFTASVLCCRKLLMHIAVSKGAPKGKSFIEYVEYLSGKHFIPPGGESWVDHIRKKSNEANHEIVIMIQKMQKT
jgi:hypothetical protein